MSDRPRDPSTSALFGEPRVDGDFSAERLRWLIDLRWVAMAGVLVAAGFAMWGKYPGINWRVMLAVVVLGSSYNALLRRSLLRDGTGPVAAVSQALIDMLMLTVVLWSAGGIRNPFMGFYIFHVALIAVLGGPRATLVAAAAAFGMAGLLALTLLEPRLQIGVWDPQPAWDTFAHVAAFVVTLTAASYVVSHAAREVRDREEALKRARDRAALEYQVMSNTLDELAAGLEVVDPDGSLAWRNRRAEELNAEVAIGGAWSCPPSRACQRASSECPVHQALHAGEGGRCRFSLTVDRGERAFEMLSFPLAGRAGHQRVMNLYVDRSAAMVQERQLVLAERLASLGRIAQGVAHELNTPLATIRTLATDMRDAIALYRKADADQRPALADEVTADVDESAALIRSETKRLAKITHSLLAGGDLVRPKLEQGVSVGAVVERARALVWAGLREGPTLTVNPEVYALHVAADADRLMQVLVNALQNAVDAMRGHTDAGTIYVHGKGDAREVVLYVDDEGPGVDPAIVARLFEPFATTKPPGEGTGLGLYTSYMLVRAMDGDLALTTRPEGGARATLRLPAAEPPETAVTTYF
jgi:C4-dicarboxylate-specific signal transduction histidine kinase